MKKIQHQYRQGDVLVNKIDEIPETAKKVSHKGKVTLAYGEASGHHHSIYAPTKDLESYTDGTQLYLRVKKPVVLEHQEHSPATIDPGDYIVIQQMEVWLDEVRAVRD